MSMTHHVDVHSVAFSIEEAGVTAKIDRAFVVEILAPFLVCAAIEVDTHVDLLRVMAALGHTDYPMAKLLADRAVVSPDRCHVHFPHVIFDGSLTRYDE